MTATITSLGHAGLDVRLGDVRLVCDPWLTPRGAYLGSWHPFPDNGAIAASALHDAPFLFISDPRPEHLDVDTLSSFPRTVRVLLPALASPTLATKIRALGFCDVVELPADQPYELGPGVQLTVLRSAHEHLSSATLVLEGQGELLVIQHDCLLDGETHARLAARKPTVHFLSLPVGSASYGPLRARFRARPPGTTSMKTSGAGRSRKRPRGSPATSSRRRARWALAPSSRREDRLASSTRAGSS